MSIAMSRTYNNIHDQEVLFVHTLYLYFFLVILEDYITVPPFQIKLLTNGSGSSGSLVGA